MIDGIPILLVLAWLVIGALVTFIVGVAFIVWFTAAALDLLVNVRPWRKRKMRDKIEVVVSDDNTVTFSWLCVDDECPICYPVHGHIKPGTYQ